jgi:hypothetical protein
MHFGEPSAHDVIEAEHAEGVLQNDELDDALFIAVLILLRHVIVSVAHVFAELTTPELMTA